MGLWKEHIAKNMDRTIETGLMKGSRVSRLGDSEAHVLRALVVKRDYRTIPGCFTWLKNLPTCLQCQPGGIMF